MKCPNCLTDNPDDSKFCKECATPFPGTGAAVPTKTLETPLKGLEIGSTIAGKYEIVEILGRGGMGVVYKAKDTKLKRTVALKFLSPELTRHAEAKERFILEAQAASALDHPNICTVYEIDESDGLMFIAMAYIEGQSLRNKIAQGPLKLEESLDIAAQVAQGQHEAHEKGIVHRDIKSSNIMITDKGQAKIMDFGIAKLAGETGFTRTGTTVGTIAYMSPEQSRGEKVDLRTDIWSLGVVLYEMVIGQLPFKGDHEQAVIYSILNENPEPMTGLRTGVPMELERIVSKALQKNPASRYQHADDILVDLRFLKENISSFLKSPVVRGPAVSTPRPKRWKRLLPWGIAILMTFMAFIFQSRLTRLASKGGDVTRYTLPVPSVQLFTSVTGPGLTISPDGRHLVYVGYGETDTQLYVRRMDRLEEKPIIGTEGAYAAFFSPDGFWLGFFSEKRLKKVELEGGQPLTICDVSETAWGACWGQDDFILIGQRDAGLAKVPSSGGTPQIVTTPDPEKGEVGHVWPEILPGGRAALFTIWRGNFESTSIGQVDLKTGRMNPFLEEGTYPKFSPTGHIVYMGTDRLLLAVPFNLERLKTEGSIVTLLDGIQTNAGGSANFTLSRNGSLVYLPALGTQRTIVLVDRRGNEQPLIEETRGFRAPRFSPDGKRIVVDLWGDGAQNIYVYGWNPFSSNRLTFEKNNYYPVWTPDGKRIVFSSGGPGVSYDLYWKKADGSGTAEPLLQAEHSQIETSISSDGKYMVYSETHPNTGIDIWVLPLEGESKPWPFLITPSNEFSPMLSPDGRFLAYTSDDSGRNEVYVQAFPNPGGGKWKMSTIGGQEPLWSRYGRELFYRGENKIISIAVETEPVFKIGPRKTLFEDVYRKWTRHTNYDIHPDNERFVFVRIPEEESLGMIVVLNWFEELKRLAPSNK